jgi:hypothetical protein
METRSFKLITNADDQLIISEKENYCRERVSIKYNNKNIA